jgi:hypothetical protein
MVISQDKLVEPTMWSANHPVQTDIRGSSFTPPNFQNNHFLSGGW